jgi:hypothetical protein
MTHTAASQGTQNLAGHNEEVTEVIRRFDGSALYSTLDARRVELGFVLEQGVQTREC